MSFTGREISGRYKIIELIGRGGTAEVYRAVDTEGREFAVKVLTRRFTSNVLDDVIRFHREAAIVSKLDHPNLVKIYEAGEYQGLHYIVMELTEGESLDNHIRHGRQLEPAEVIDIVIQITKALAHVHNAGVIHGDLKPANLLVSSGKTEGVTSLEVKLLDFGLAQVMDFTQITEPEEITGTFSYMSPEQSGIISKPVDERSDLYSLGVIFYQMITSRLPFGGESIGEILHQHMAKKPLPPGRIRPGIPAVLEEVVLKLLKKRP